MKSLSFAIVLLLTSLQLSANQAYPKPEPSFTRLFYLQRSTNANTVVYDARLTQTGQLDPERPIEVYWRRYSEDGQRKGLSFIERQFAYGVDIDSEHEERYSFNLTALPEREVKLRLDKSGKPQVVTRIEGDRAKLRFVYVQVDDDSGFWPTIEYVELHGVSLTDGREITERIEP